MISNPHGDRVVDITPLFSIPSCPEEARTVSQRVAYLLSDLHELLPEAPAMLEALHRDLPLVLRSAFDEENSLALLEIHQTLFEIYETALSHPLAKICLHEHSPWLMTVRHQIETAWLDYELPRLRHQLPHEVETKDPKLLCDWFVEQAKSESEIDRWVLKFLRDEASVEEFNTFVLSDAMLNYRFCDALALAQIHFSETVKAEIASNMFEECGNGVAANAHSRQLTRMLIGLGIEPPTLSVWGDDYRPYAGHNLYFFLGLNRKHFLKSIGSLAMPELFDPDRDRAVVAGLARLYPARRVNYDFYASHIETDRLHGWRWLNNAIAPIVRAQPEAGMELAIGGALRMEAMRRYNQYLSVRFGLLPSG
jgi:hypothetical protein